MDQYLPGLTLSDRATSGFPLSIGTGLAFETLFPPRQAVYDPNREIPKHEDSSQYQTCWINVETLFRNMVSSVDKGAFVTASVQQLLTTILEEIEVIESLFQYEGRGVTVPVFYVNNLRSLERNPPHQVTFRTPTPDGQKFYDGRLRELLEKLHKSTDKLEEYSGDLRPKDRTNDLIITHIPYDLTSYTRFGGLTLLESNTGRIKSRISWSSKYCPMSGVSFSRLPFTRKLLWIFGDRVHIKPMTPKIRTQIVEIADKCKWSGLTTPERVALDLSLNIRDPYFAAVFNALKDA